jgi:hypothetical protein
MTGIEMRDKRQQWKVLTVSGLILLASGMVAAEERASDTLPPRAAAGHRFVHKIGIEARPGYVIRAHPFLQGENETGRPVKNSLSTHLKYAFQPQPDSYAGRIFGGVYQGVGLARYTFGESRQIGNPVALYLFQGARLAGLRERMSLNYEWNFGLSAGWNPYDPRHNPGNVIIGSRLNAYLNMNFDLNWMLSGALDLTAGVTLTHFSNGNTRFPNAGLNTAGMKAGLVYNFNRKKRFMPELLPPAVPDFPLHISYDLVLYGSWRRKGIDLGDERVALPDAYTVLGFNFSPMYNAGYRIRAGVSLDGFYDGSANIRALDYVTGAKPALSIPPLRKQMALGFSGRTEYVMPYFSVNLGLGVNVLHSGGDIRNYYQILALKIKVTRNTFLHIGYSLQNFNTPNSLMLGFGYRFNNRYPVL